MFWTEYNNLPQVSKMLPGNSRKTPSSKTSSVTSKYVIIIFSDRQYSFWMFHKDKLNLIVNWITLYFQRIHANLTLYQLMSCLCHWIQDFLHEWYICVVVWSTFKITSSCLRYEFCSLDSVIFTLMNLSYTKSMKLRER